MSDWCKGFCGLCGTGCAEYCDTVMELRNEISEYEFTIKVLLKENVRLRESLNPPKETE